VGAGGDEVGDGGLRVAAGDEGLADEDRVGSRVGVGDEVVRAADAGFGDLDDVRGDLGGDALEGGAVDLEGLEVARVDADDPGARVDGALDLVLVCTSTSGVSPMDSARSMRETSASCSRAATMRSARSAPYARASQSWYAVTMKSLRRTGMSTLARTASRSASDPPKRRSSVSTEMTAAPPAS
jgi:hypothetical protein